MMNGAVVPLVPVVGLVVERTVCGASFSEVPKRWVLWVLVPV